MSVETLADKKNALLKRREVVCVFRGQAGKLRRKEAAELVSRELKIDAKFVIPITLRCETGRTDLKGTFYVYDDENLAKTHLPQYIFDRLSGKKKEKEAPKEEAPKEGKAKEAEAKAEAGEEKTAEGAEKAVKEKPKAAEAGEEAKPKEGKAPKKEKEA